MGKEKKSWWERQREGCCALAFIKDIRPECLTDEARIHYKDELQTQEEVKMRNGI
jgi:hypothetical protein